MNHVELRPGIPLALVIVGVAFSILACEGSRDSGEKKDSDSGLSIQEIGGDELPRDPSGEADFVMDFGEIIPGSRMMAIVLAPVGEFTLQIALDEGVELADWISFELEETEIQPGSALLVQFSISAWQEGAYETTLVFRTNGKKEKWSLRIQGTAKSTKRIDLDGDALKANPFSSTDYELDFGAVVLANPRTLEVEVTNRSSQFVVVEMQRSDADDDWLSFAPASLELEAGETKGVEVSVDPPTPMPVNSSLEFSIDESVEARVRVKAEVALPEFECDDEVNIGKVLLGEENSAVFKCTNSSPRPIEISIGEFVGVAGEQFSASFVEGGAQKVVIADGATVERECPKNCVRGLHGEGVS